MRRALVALAALVTAGGLCASVPAGAAALSCGRPIVDRVSPASSGTNGGGIALVTGRCLVHARVLFGGAQAHVLNDTGRDGMYVVIPPHAPGTMKVQARTSTTITPPGYSATFTYVAAPVITATSPSPQHPGWGPVTITGAHFTPTSRIVLDGRVLTTHSASTTEVWAEIPKDVPSGDHQVRVRTQYGVSPTASIRVSPAWAPRGTTTHPETLSCGAPTFCMTASQHQYSVFDGVWHAPVTEPLIAEQARLSCPAAGFCVATSDSGALAVYDGSAWSVERLGSASGAVRYVDCLSDRTCVAVDADGRTWLRDGAGAWTVTDAPPAPRTASTMSCASVHLCVLSGFDPAIATWDGSTWTSDQIVPTPTDTIEHLSASCDTAGFCVAGDYRGSVFYRSAPGQQWAAADGMGYPVMTADCGATMCVLIDEGGRGLRVTPTTRTAQVVDLAIFDTGQSRDYTMSCAGDAFCMAAITSGLTLVGPTP